MLCSLFRARRLAGVTIAGIVFAAASLQAAVAAPKLIPAKASMVLSIPDTAKLHRACLQSDLTQIVKQVIEASGAKDIIATSMGVLPEIEKELGFSLDGPTMTGMIPAVDIFVVSNGEDGKPTGGLIAKIGAPDKFSRFIAYWEKAAEKAAREARAEDETTTGSAASEFITTRSVEGTIVKHFSTAQGTDVFYATVDSHFVVVTEPELIAGVLSRAKSAKSEGSFASLDDFAKVEKVLDAKPGEIFVYQNHKAGADSPAKQPAMKKLQDLMRDLTPQSLSGMAIALSKDSLRAYSYAPFSAGSENSFMRKLLERSAASGSLDILQFAPERAALAIATNAFDAPLFYDILRELAQAAAGNDKQADLDKQLKELEPVLGFSVKNDLIPSLGSEVGAVISSLSFSPMVSVEGAVVVKIRDKEKIQRVLNALERMVDERTKAMMPPAGPDKTKSAEIAFKTAKEGDLSIRYLEIPPLPMFSPGYAFVGDYLLIATTKETIQNLAAVKNGKEKSLLASGKLDRVGGITAKGISFGYINFAPFLDAVEDVSAKAASGAEQLKAAIQSLRKIRAGAGYVDCKDGAIVGESVLVFGTEN